MELSEIKRFIKVDDDTEDDDIETLKQEAEIYLSDSGVKKNYKNKLYCRAIKYLVGYWYDNRSPVAIGKTSKNLEFSLADIIIKLSSESEGDSDV